VTCDVSQGASFGPKESGQAWLKATPTAGASTYGGVASQGANSVTYTPNAGFCGTATFTYTLQDNSGTDNSGMDTSGPATATVKGGLAVGGHLQPARHRGHDACLVPRACCW
jgi:hypothetical protein